MRSSSDVISFKKAKSDIKIDHSHEKSTNQRHYEPENKQQVAKI